MVGGLDFSVSKPAPTRTYTPPAEQNKPVERMVCDVCRGSGVTTTQTSYSNSARQTCWRCKGRGWRSPHDM